MRRVAALVLIILLGGLASTVDAQGTPEASPQASPIADPPGCDGLIAYREAMLKIGRDFLAALERDGLTSDRERITYSTDDWTAMADIELAYQRALKKVTPPDWVKAWHQSVIEYAGLYEQFAKTAAEYGIFAGSAFSDLLDEANAKSDRAADAASAKCHAFRYFQREWLTLDEEDLVTPTPTPAD